MSLPISCLRKRRLGFLRLTIRTDRLQGEYFPVPETRRENDEEERDGHFTPVLKKHKLTWPVLANGTECAYTLLGWEHSLHVVRSDVGRHAEKQSTSERKRPVASSARGYPVFA